MSRRDKQDEHLPTGAIVYWSRISMEGWDYRVPVWCPDCKEERNVHVDEAARDTFTGLCRKHLNLRRSAAARSKYPSADERLANGNVVHWSEIFSSAWGKLHVPVTCADCGRKRTVQVVETRRARFTGWCVQRQHWHTDAAPGTRHKDGSGYIDVKLGRDHPCYGMANKKGWVLEHRLVMAESRGRPLEAHETVHHRNGRRDDNRLENLELWLKGHPIGQRAADVEEEREPSTYFWDIEPPWKKHHHLPPVYCLDISAKPRYNYPSPPPRIDWRGVSAG